jgi:lysophospholipase L1-like esterase
LLIGIEAVGQISYYLLNGYFIHEKFQRRVFELHPYLVGRLKPNTVTSKGNILITATEKSTRWTGAPEDDQNLIRVAVLGGSSTFGARVTDKESWAAILQTVLGDKYSVTNYGVPGYSTAEAIIQMALLVPENRPHVVVFYEGWNDIRNYHDPKLGADYYNHGIEQYNSLGIDIGYKKTFLQMITKYSTTFKLADMLGNIILTARKKENSNSKPVYEVRDEFVDRIYLRNLKTLKLLSKNINAKILFVPQILNVSEFYGKKDSRRWSPFIRDDAMPKLLNEFNSIMDKVCNKNEMDCLVVNEVSNQDWKSDDFVDEGHFSREGGVKFALIIAKYLRKLCAETNN